MKRFYAEGIGTFIVVFAGCGAAAVGGKTIGTIGIALAFGLAFAAASLALGPVSGAHLNPAVTLAAALAGRMRTRDALPYIASQIAGATAGVGLTITIARGRPGGAPGVLESLAGGYGRYSPGFYGTSSVLAMEIGLSAILAFVLLGATSHAQRAPHRPTHPRHPTHPTHAAHEALPAAAGGIAYALIHLVGIPVAGLPAHPARAIGAALALGGPALDQLWLFVLGPLLGGAIAALALRFLFAGDLNQPKIAPAASQDRAPSSTS